MKCGMSSDGAHQEAEQRDAPVTTDACLGREPDVHRVVHDVARGVEVRPAGRDSGSPLVGWRLLAPLPLRLLTPLALLRLLAPLALAAGAGGRRGGHWPCCGCCPHWPCGCAAGGAGGHWPCCGCWPHWPCGWRGRRRWGPLALLRLLAPLVLGRTGRPLTRGCALAGGGCAPWGCCGGALAWALAAATGRWPAAPIGWAEPAAVAATAPVAARCRSGNRYRACRWGWLATADQVRTVVGSRPRRCSTVGLVAGGRFELPTNGL